MSQDSIPTDARLAFFNETRHSYGRTALLLSGGAALGFYHVGVVKTLMSNRLMPRVIGGGKEDFVASIFNIEFKYYSPVQDLTMLYCNY